MVGEGWAQSMACYFCLQQQQPLRPATSVPGHSLSPRGGWRGPAFLPPDQHTGQQAKSPERVKALTPILALRAMDHWVRRVVS